MSLTRRAYARVAMKRVIPSGTTSSPNSCSYANTAPAQRIEKREEVKVERGPGEGGVGTR